MLFDPSEPNIFIPVLEMQTVTAYLWAQSKHSKPTPHPHVSPSNHWLVRNKDFGSQKCGVRMVQSAPADRTCVVDYAGRYMASSSARSLCLIVAVQNDRKLRK